MRPPSPALFALMFVYSTAAQAPCTLTTAPWYHVTNMGIGPHDVNAIFNYRGTWHCMHQANWTDWAHLVSTDLAHWTRVPSALYPNGGQMAGQGPLSCVLRLTITCLADWDGSLTIMDDKPVILYDCYNVPDWSILSLSTT